MSDLSDLKITGEDIAQNGVVSAPDRLTGTAAENKTVFDRLIRESVKGKHNALVTALEESLVWEAYDAEKDYVPDNKAVYNGSSYLCTTACRGVLPTNTDYWRLIAAKGRDGTGAGDMVAEIYDPNGVEADIFAYAAERADTYTKDEVFAKAEVLSAETAQKFVDAGLSQTAPATPDEATEILAAAAALIDGKAEKTTKVNGASLSSDVVTAITGEVSGSLTSGYKFLTPFIPSLLIMWYKDAASSNANGFMIASRCMGSTYFVAFSSTNPHANRYTITWNDDGITFSGGLVSQINDAKYYISA